MALDELFDIIPKNVNDELSLQELGCCQDEERTRADVLEAHKLLVEINPKCEAEFIDLIRYLENEVSIQ